MNLDKLSRFKRRSSRTRRKLKLCARDGFLRLSFQRSNKFLYAQLIDDSLGHTICHMNTKNLANSDFAKTVNLGIESVILNKKDCSSFSLKNLSVAYEFGVIFGKFLEKNVKEKLGEDFAFVPGAFVFDRSGYLFHGKVAKFVEGVRAAGIPL